MQNTFPQQADISTILKKAFYYWNRTLKFQILFSILYFSLFFAGYIYLLQYFGIWEEFNNNRHLAQSDMAEFNQKMAEIMSMPQARNFSLAFFILTALLNPLHVGLYQIYRKTDLNEPVLLNDLFAGYQGISFFKFFGFYLFWMVVFTYTNALFLLGIVWFFVTLFSVPLMLFMDVKIFEGISLTFKVLKKNVGAILVTTFVAILFCLSGILICGIGFLITFPFWSAMVYTLYQHFFKEVE